jgi:hypothetical protein
MIWAVVAVKKRLETAPARGSVLLGPGDGARDKRSCRHPMGGHLLEKVLGSGPRRERRAFRRTAEPDHLKSPIVDLRLLIRERLEATRSKDERTFS